MIAINAMIDRRFDRRSLGVNSSEDVRLFKKEVL
jgi:hypothetical protein